MSGFRWSIDRMPEPVKDLGRGGFEVWLVARDGERRWVYPLAFTHREAAQDALLGIDMALRGVNSLAEALEQEQEVSA